MPDPRPVSTPLGPAGDAGTPPAGRQQPRKLANNRSARWAWMDRFAAPNYEGDGVYLTRWRVIQTPWFGLYVHRYEGPDPRPTLHDHPWGFLSFVLRGGYVERRLNTEVMAVEEARAVRRLNFVRAADAHSIRRLLRVPTWTVLLVGRRIRTWGYWTPDGDRWVWQEFNKHPHNAEFVAALKRAKATTPAARGDQP